MSSDSEIARIDWLPWGVVPLVLLAAGCVGAPSSTQRPSGRPLVQPSSSPDVVVIVIDALRADELGCYGSTLGLTPTIDALAASGVRFDRALATSSWTVPSVASLVTGLLPQKHGVERGAVRHHEVVRLSSLRQELTTLAEVFQAQGYSTVGVMANVHLTESQGFDQGFDSFHNAGWSTAPAVLEWLEEHRDEPRAEGPRLTWVHLFDPHHPYRPRWPWFGGLLGGNESPRQGAEGLAWELAGSSVGELESRGDLELGGELLPLLRAAYRSEVAQLDGVLAQLLELLEVTPDTLVVLTADHGEEFREHGNLGHRSSLYSELLRVPLIVTRPSLLTPGQVAQDQISMVDLFPTVLELAALPSPEGLDGDSLFDGDQLRAPVERPVISTVLQGDARITSIGLGRSRLISDLDRGWVELYDEVSDPTDRRDLSARRPDEVERLRRRLEASLEGIGSGDDQVAPAALSPEQVEQLRSLGYLE